MDAITDDPRAGELTLHIERRLSAPRELVFQAWIDPAHLRRWSAPHGYEIPECGGEARPGGTWHTTMRSPEGKLLRMVGAYREIVPPERLVFTHTWLDEDGTPGPETVITVELTAVDGGTLLDFTQTGFARAEARDSHLGGWGQCFERLERHLSERD